MRLPLFASLASLLFLSSVPALAQAPSPLSAAILARFPSRAIIPLSCQGLHELETGSGDRICLRDATTGRTRAVRRLTLGGSLEAARSGDQVFFSVVDPEGVSTRYSGRTWRWDLTRDAYLGVARTSEDSYVALVRGTSFGVLYASRAGFQLHREGTATRVSVPWEETYEVGRFLVADGATFEIRTDPTRVTVARVELNGTRITTQPHASFGSQLHHADGRFVVSVVRGRARAMIAHVLRLPSADVVDVTLPDSMRRVREMRLIDETHLLMTGPRGTRALLDLGASPPTVSVPDAEPPLPSLLTASSLYSFQPTRGGIYLGSSSRGFALSSSGVSSPRSAPGALRSRCVCDGAAMVCGGTDTRVEGACPDVQDLEVIRDYERRIPPTQFSPDGAYRLDRVEADHGRVTRLRDGARLWVRIFGNVLFAQTDDGHYFLSDRSLVDRLSLRDGASITSAPLVPLATRAALYDEHLIESFFAAP